MSFEHKHDFAYNKTYCHECSHELCPTCDACYNPECDMNACPKETVDLLQERKK